MQCLILICFSVIIILCDTYPLLQIQNDLQNSSLHLASLEQKKADESVLRLVEEQKASLLKSSFNNIILFVFIRCSSLFLLLVIGSIQALFLYLIKLVILNY